MAVLSALTRTLSAVLGGLSELGVLWKQWNLRSFVISSFVLQLVLILVAPFRKQSSNGLIAISVWLSYLLADWVAVQAVGFIPKSLGDDAQSDLLAFWAQFLLVHLGGPDTVTALALEDNELWLRTGLQLGTQVYATFGVLVKGLRHSKLWAPTILMFMAGTIKYLERVISLLHGRLNNCDEEPDYYAKLLEESEPKDWDAGLPLTNEDAIDPSNGHLSEIEMVRHAFFFFHYYRGLYADRIFRSHEWQTSASYFLRRTSIEVFKVLELEFKFAYDCFFTKMVMIHQYNKAWKVLRWIVLMFQAVSLAIWCFAGKHGFHIYDIRITYTLLIGAIAVDLLTFARIQCSIWNIAGQKRYSCFRRWFYNGLLASRSRTWGRYWGPEEAPAGPWLRRAFFRRWSESISQFNLINYCADERSDGLMKYAIERFSFVKNVFDGMRYEKKKWFPDELRDVIFTELRPRLELNRKPGVFENIPTGKDWEVWCSNLESKEFTFIMSMKDMEFDDSLLILHVATEICYEWDREEGDGKMYREFCKVVSDYMLYLLIRQPSMMSTVAGTSKVKFRDTCAHLKEVLGMRELRCLSAGKDKARRHQETCHHLLKWHDKFTRGGGESVLIKAVHLAVKLRQQLEVKRKDTWEAAARLWVAALLYAAKHCKPNVHAAQLKRGGELLSFVWLLSVHFGLGQPFKY